MLRIKITALLIFLVSAVGFAQDSVKKTAVIKPAAPNKVYKYHGYPYRKVSTATKATYQTTPAKTDSLTTAGMPADKSLNSQYQYLLSKVYRLPATPYFGFMEKCFGYAER